MSDYQNSYLCKLRAVVEDHRKLITSGARAVITNKKGEFLLIRRSDNKMLAMAAGSAELGESIMQTLIREVREETGLIIDGGELISIYTHPRYDFVTMWGDHYQRTTFVFWINSWEGDIATTTTETVNARFFGLDDLHENMDPIYRETVEDLMNFKSTRRVLVK